MSTPELDIIKSPEGLRMLGHVTEGFYDNSYVGLWLFEVMGIEIDDMLKWTEEIRLEAFPQSAYWSLSFWEDSFGISKNRGLSADRRRKAILTRCMEEAPANPRRFEIAAGLIVGMPVEVIEYCPEYRFTFKVDLNSGVGSAGMYERLYDFARSNKPSHLSFDVFAKANIPVKSYIYGGIGKYVKTDLRENKQLPIVTVRRGNIHTHISAVKYIKTDARIYEN